MKKILSSNVLLITLLVFIVCFLISYISTDVVLSDQVYNKYLDEKYEAKYNEFKDLDIDLSEFEEELSQFESNEDDDTSYGWDYFYIDSIAISVPLLLVVLGFSATFLLLILFHKRLNTINFLHITKTSLIAFLVFYIPEIISAIYFLIFKKDYEMVDIRNFDQYFKFSNFFEKESTPQWLWDIVSETGFIYILFPLVVGLLLSLLYGNLKKITLISYSYLAYAIVFIFYNTVFWYLFDLV